MAQNRKARHDYEILEKYEAGLVLQGKEVKSLRLSRVSLTDSFAFPEKGELFLYNLHIAPYSFSSQKSYNPQRKRKLLFHKQEIKKITGKVTQRGLTLIPLEVYFNQRGLAKINLALVKAKKTYDRREEIKLRDLKREASKNFKERIRI